MRTYIENDDLYRHHPHAHAVALSSFEEVTEESYPGVEGWYVEAEEVGGTVTGVYEPVWAEWYQAMREATTSKREEKRREEERKK